MNKTMIAWLLISAATVNAENWPAWRGADGSGISTDRNLPVWWSATENIRWKVPLPEPCNSTPIVWEDHVFLTQGLDGGKRRALIETPARSSGNMNCPVPLKKRRIGRTHLAAVLR